MINVDSLQNGNLILVKSRLFMVSAIIKNNGESPIINGNFQDGQNPIVGDYVGSECNPIELKENIIIDNLELIEKAQIALNLKRVPYYHELQNYMKFTFFT